jgi:hypothetical protein
MPITPKTGSLFHADSHIVSLLDRRSKKRRGSMVWQAEQEKQKKAGRAAARSACASHPRVYRHDGALTELAIMGP